MKNLDELKAEWFEFGRQSGLREAEERIIRLLESKGLWLAHLDRLDEVETLRNIILLIKGEQK